MIPALREQLVQHDGVADREEDRDGHREARQVLLDDVRVPPCDVGVKPMPPKPASRPECMSTRPTSAAPSRTWITAQTETIAGAQGGGESTRACRMARRRRRARKVQRLLVTGDNRLKQGVPPEKVRESYEQALEVAREAGLEDAVRPLVEIRLADLDARQAP